MRTFVAAVVLFLGFVMFCMADTDQEVTEAPYNYDVETGEGEVNIIIFRQYRNSMCFCNFKVEKKLLPMINIQITSEAQDLYTAFNLILV